MPTKLTYEAVAAASRPEPRGWWHRLSDDDKKTLLEAAPAEVAVHVGGADSQLSPIAPLPRSGAFIRNMEDDDVHGRPAAQSLVKASVSAPSLLRCGCWLGWLRCRHWRRLSRCRFRRRFRCWH